MLSVMRTAGIGKRMCHLLPVPAVLAAVATASTQSSLAVDFIIVYVLEAVMEFDVEKFCS